jgi:gluconokinase
MIVVLMGVCGCGKSTVGVALANTFGWTFLDADDFHPEANVAKMATGIPLTDADRWPWLDRMVGELQAIERQGHHVVLACSALRKIYRDRLDRAGEIRWVYLKGDAATIEPRMASRSGHFMPATLLASQFATLEEPSDAIVIDISQSVAAQAAQIAATLRSTV